MFDLDMSIAGYTEKHGVLATLLWFCLAGFVGYRLSKLKFQPTRKMIEND